MCCLTGEYSCVRLGVLCVFDANIELNNIFKALNNLCLEQMR